MSAQKQQQQPQSSNSKRELEADFLFNQHIVRTVGYTAAGFGFGLATSLLFKHKAGMTMFFSGAGAGYGASNFFNDLHQFRKYKNLGQNQGQQYQRSGPNFEQFGARGSELAGGLQGFKNQAKEAVDQAQNKFEQGAQNLKEKGKEAVGQAKNAGEQAYNKASEGLQNAKDQAKSAADQAQNKAGEQFQNAKDQAKNLAGQAKNAFDNAKDKAKDAADSAKDKAKDASSQAKNTFENAKDQAKNAADNLKDKAKDAASQAKNHFENAKDQAKNSADNAKDQAKNAGENLKNQAKDAAENLKNKASDAANKAKDAAKDSTKEKEQQAQKRIDETVPNLKESGKDIAGGTSRNAGGDPWNRPSSEDFRRADESATKVAKQQQAKNQKSDGDATTAQADHNADATESVKGQTFQSFDSNSHKEGLAGPIHKIQTNYQENRNRFREQTANENRTNLTRQGQDPYFKSETEGIGRVNEAKSDTQMGFHNYNPQGTESLKKNKIETDASSSEHGKVA